MKLLTKILRVFTGLIFIFSGFVKGVDPLGTSYKITDYFLFLGAGSWDTLSLGLSVILCTAEFITGIMLLSGAFIKTASWMAMIFMLAFTPLTLYLAIFNPISDCGCFGDAIHLSNWQTFFKNVIIFAIVIFLFIRRKDQGWSLTRRASAATVTVFTLLFWLFTALNIINLPLIDFRPYKTGTDINKAMTVPPGAPADKYDIRFIYEKNGEQKLFTINDYPANDTTWKFVDQKSVLISKGYVPPVHDFSLVTSDGLDITGEVLSDPGYTLLMVTGKVEKAAVMNLVKGFRIAEKASVNNVKFYSLTASSKKNAAPLAARYPVLYCDEVTLKTVIRANPGFVLLHHGIVLAKWSVMSLPEPAAFSNPEKVASEKRHSDNSRKVITFVLLGVLIISAFCLPFWRKEQS